MSHKSSIFALKSDMLLRKKYILFLLACCGMWACTHKVPEETLQVVAQADSLWQAGKMYGIDEGDSLTLAQAYETLKDLHSSLFSFVLSPSSRQTYAHACYHYGKLLRAKGDPEEAMRCFINATQGRVYSNMGSICHLAGEFQLSYDMYEKSADMFLQNGDTLAYYYGLNDMAFEKAMLADKEACLACLHTIEQNCSDRDVILKTMETKAELCLKHKQYDSAIICSNYLIEAGFDNTSVMLIKAQAYDDLSLPDSALLYAKMIMERSCVSPQERFNAIFIILHNDSTLDGDSINALASQREDIRYYDYEPRKNLCMQAVQLLEKDLTSKPDWRWLYAVIATVLIIGTAIVVYVYRKHKKHDLLVQKISDLTLKSNAVQANHEKLVNRYESQHQRREEETLHRCDLLRECPQIAVELKWSDFDAVSNIIDSHFYLFVTKLRQKAVLNETEIRLCILVLIGLNRIQIANTMPYALNSIGKLKDQTAKKLGTSGKNLRDFLIKIVVDE